MAYISQLNGPLAWAYCLGVVSLFIIVLLVIEWVINTVRDRFGWDWLDHDGEY